MKMLWCSQGSPREPAGVAAAHFPSVVAPKSEKGGEGGRCLVAPVTGPNAPILGIFRDRPTQSR
jgi:hypothetical protein